MGSILRISFEKEIVKIDMYCPSCNTVNTFDITFSLIRKEDGNFIIDFSKLQDTRVCKYWKCQTSFPLYSSR